MFTLSPSSSSSSWSSSVHSPDAGYYWPSDHEDEEEYDYDGDTSSDSDSDSDSLRNLEDEEGSNYGGEISYASGDSGSESTTLPDLVHHLRRVLRRILRSRDGNNAELNSILYMVIRNTIKFSSCFFMHQRRLRRLPWTIFICLLVNDLVAECNMPSLGCGNLPYTLPTAGPMVDFSRVRRLLDLTSGMARELMDMLDMMI